VALLLIFRLLFYLIVHSLELLQLRWVLLGAHYWGGRKEFLIWFVAMFWAVRAGRISWVVKEVWILVFSWVSSGRIHLKEHVRHILNWFLLSWVQSSCCRRALKGVIRGLLLRWINFLDLLKRRPCNDSLLRNISSIKINLSSTISNQIYYNIIEMRCFLLTLFIVFNRFLIRIKTQCTTLYRASCQAVIDNELWCSSILEIVNNYYVTRRRSVGVVTFHSAAY